MPGEQLESLIDTPAIREAVAIVLERTNGENEELQWGDVKDALSSGQWGRLIEEGILVSGSSGFVLSNPEHIRQKFDKYDASSETAAQVDKIETEPWAWYDKVAGVCALIFFIGYWSPQIRNVIASVDNIILGPVTHALPFYAVVLLLALVTGLYSTVLQSRLMDTEKIQQYKDRMERLNRRKETAEEREDEEALAQIQKEQMKAAGDQLGMFKLQFRPMVWIMVLTIPVFLWLRWKVRGGHLGVGETGLIVPLAGSVSWQQTLLGLMPTWIVWYFLCSMAARQVIQKTLNIQISPS
ncbi:DUF106 domain-containing protein [Halocatena marina]|uniref:DUF106 domain-containing protein n=1 Tax=Halocatena marina TaxID=2934937 RepID=A0ABD5YKV4_9EURY|nr:DUF106 domain-containing protein [Halocatena marina]